MNAHLIDACEEIDAAMFSGDSFLEENNRKELKEYIERWQRAMKSYETIETD